MPDEPGVEEGVRDTAARFRRLIRTHGPIPVSQFMGESNARYYAARDPLGEAGDFTTAPEISQMFGELVGLWLADLWMRAGKPERAHYVELGPGRGTLAKDALRAMRQVGLAPEVHLVEGSPALRAVQAQAVPEAHFHDDPASVPEDAPLLLVANEFLDALPVRQLVRSGPGWRERMVGLDGEAFVFVAGDRPMDSAVPPERRDAPEGTIIETSPAAAASMQEIARRLAAQGGAALLIDYGYDAPRTGSTLQAVKRHEKIGVFAHPGDSDLTAHVDFAALRDVAHAHGARWDGTTAQGWWLRALGIDARAAALARSAPDRDEEIRAAHRRLTDPKEMGALFKVMAIASPDWPEGAGFG
ncbi:SAM-dependent methyltransferase [Erythrobacter sp. LQ02-29]|uniref:class I SAM-dependent methyltransferase n=1 Tax=Erythrobacter sp. LQ02-29 TaxID=2920384 RepID=UPI001F4EAF97|nr:SAM-dependent methyltransferase [Erythrobacter sp. LQ02-29]MCP9222101.1 SAM-dependent methyltransferase [Erythrobacter sp. LQ02-29]